MLDLPSRVRAPLQEPEKEKNTLPFFQNKRWWGVVVKQNQERHQLVSPTICHF